MEQGSATTPATPAPASGEVALFNQLVDEKRANCLPAEEPETFKSLVDRMLADIPPPPTPEEASRLREDRAQFLARQQKSEREARWRSLAGKRGERYRNCTLSGYECSSPPQEAARSLLIDYAEHMPDRVRDGVGVVLFGPAGTGKDHLMAALMRAAVTKYGLSVRWENGMDLFGDLRDRIDEGSSEAQWVRSMAHPQILAISDPLPPFGTIKEFQAAMLFRVIDRRYSEGKPIWVTMNARNRQEAEERMGVQMIDRLSHGAVVVFCNWPSYRAKP